MITKKFYINVLIKGKGDVKDELIKIEAKLYDYGKAIEIAGECEAITIIGLTNKRKVFIKNNDGRYEVI